MDKRSAEVQREAIVRPIEVSWDFKWKLVSEYCKVSTRFFLFTTHFFRYSQKT